MQEVLGVIQRQLEDLEILFNVAANPDHRHGGDRNCTKCHELLHDTRSISALSAARSAATLRTRCPGDSDEP